MRRSNLPVPASHDSSALPAVFDRSLFDPYGEVREVKLREYWRIVWKYRLLLGLITGASVIVALLLAFTATPLYTAQTKLRIGVYEPTLSAAKIEDLLTERSKDNTYFETQVQEIRSLSLADRVLGDTTVKPAFQAEREGGFFAGIFGHKEPTIDPISGYRSPVANLKRYLEMITVEPLRRTSLVTIKATAKSPTTAALLANKHAENYVEWIRDSRIQQQAQGLKFLKAQAEELREKVADLEREMADYAEANSIVAINKDENITVQKMADLNKLLTEATAKRIELENNYKQSVVSLEGAGTGYEDPTSQQLRSDLAKFESEYRLLSEKFTPSYPKMQQLAAQIGSLKSALKNQRSQIAEGLKSKMEAAIKEEGTLKEELERQKSQAYELSKRSVQYNILNRELTASRDLLQNVLKEIKETGLSAQSKASNASIVDLAVTPSAPSYPRKMVFLVIGLVVGVIIGLASAFVLSYLDNSIRTPEDLSTTLRLPCLGVVPSFDLEGVSSRRRALPAPQTTATSGDEAEDPSLPVIAFVRDPKSLASEAYRTIRTAVLLSQAGEPPRSMLVTSAQSSEGKTTSAVNLAASLASAGGTIALIDADLRRPSVSRYFGIERNQAGLVDVITGQLAVEDVILRDSFRRIDVIPSGKIPPNPAELLGSPEMKAIIDHLCTTHDYVIIDSPPILPVTDSVILSRFVDGVVMVVKGASTPRKLVQDARDKLFAIGARFLGVILNDVDVTSGDYYYYNRYYHNYHTDEDHSEKVAV